MSKKIIVLDDVLSLDDCATFQDQHFCLSDPMPNMWADKEAIPNYFKNLISVASQHFDLSEAVGYEWWTQKNTYTAKGWHYDLDEDIWKHNLKVVPPICSIIYYPLVSCLKGGELILEDLKIQPKTNRMILMSQNVPHMIAPYNIDEATRWSFLCNPWSYKLNWARPTWINKP